MKKFILGMISAMLITSLSFNFSSCDEDTVSTITSLITGDSTSNFLGIFGKDSTNGRGDFLAGVVESILAKATNSDTTNKFAGVWAYASTDGAEIDTIWFYRDSTMLEHYISTEDTLDIQYSGGFLYYASFKQMIVQINSVYDYNTKRNINYDEYHIYGVTEPWYSGVLTGKQMRMQDLNTQTGEVISDITYSYVSDVDESK